MILSPIVNPKFLFPQKSLPRMPSPILMRSLPIYEILLFLPVFRPYIL